MDPINDDDDDDDDESEDAVSARFAPASAKSIRGSRGTSRRSSVASGSTFEDARRKSLFADMFDNVIGTAASQSVNISFGSNNMSTEKSRRSSVNRKSGASDVSILPDRQSVATILPDRKSVASNVTVLPDDLTDAGSHGEADVDKENIPIASGRKSVGRKSVVAFEDDETALPSKNTPAKAATPRRASVCVSEKSCGTPGGIFQVGRYKHVELPEIEDSANSAEEEEDFAPEVRRWKVKARGRTSKFCASTGKLRFMSNFAREQNARAWRSQVEQQEESKPELSAAFLAARRRAKARRDARRAAENANVIE